MKWMSGVRAMGVVLVLMPAVPAGVMAQKDCYEGVFCVFAERHERYVDIFVENRQPGEVTVRFAMTLENLRPEIALPYTATYPGEATTRVMRLWLEDETAGWSYRFDMDWIHGSLEARHDDAYVYALPYPPGHAFTVGQGYDGAFSHRGHFALDWIMPVGTPVLAAREGVVVEVRDTFREGGADEALRDRANRIKIRHDDGTIGAYVHLMRGGARVRVGQRVRRGQVIGLSGNTGYSTGPHLHFEVYKIEPNFRRRTFPVRFRVDGHPEGVYLAEGQAYRH
ncbi:M23 family metallopeptidase [Rhodocaloribacter litoris]|uniref:M23 family metallopeptidase n=1 Tax=Rhodocaloribacter litoris TaxID=2558931 RepID=UPI00141F861C|nr:M23 family metallopeptidase [Rhodocaloribacter litoris]QXD14601.1 M23 family metallopeptidase [Rhodocaloribacter litoris]GIV59628.1 MAG: hypothetical protein KatS3mg043_0717 [Rhodothermaceae bacterium]